MSLFQRLLLAFIIIPILEIYLLIKVGSIIGGLTTILLVIVTAIIGTHLLRSQGIATLQKVQTTLQQGQMPTEALLEGIFIILGGALLLTPGFFTDAVGFICLIPILRQSLVSWLRKRIQLTPSSFSQSSPKSPFTIEGDYRRED
jgi:UPF0716 protein FxsA